MSRGTFIALGLAALKAAVASPAAEAPTVADAHSGPLITPPPALQRRDFAADFFGYALYDNGDIETYTCNYPLTYSASGGYAGCAGRGTSLGQYCGSNYLTYVDGASVSCRDYCVTNVIYYSTDDILPSWNVDCAAMSYGLKILRTSLGDTQSSLGPVTIEKTVTPTITPTPPITTSPTGPTSTPTNPSSTGPIVPIPIETEKPKKSMAPIIGGAVGGVCVLLGLLGLGLFIFFRKRRSQNNNGANAGGFGNQHNQPALVSPTPYSPQPPMAGFNQGYASPMGSPPMSPYQPSPVQPYSPPPVYGQEKSASYNVTTAPLQQAEYRLPENTAEVHGISAQGQPDPGPRKGANELA